MSSLVTRIECQGQHNWWCVQPPYHYFWGRYGHWLGYMQMDWTHILWCNYGNRTKPFLYHWRVVVALAVAGAAIGSSPRAALCGPVRERCNVMSSLLNKFSEVLTATECKKWRTEVQGIAFAYCAQCWLYQFLCGCC